MKTVIEILMIDDDKDNFYSLQGTAAKNRIILKYAENLQDGLSLIKGNKKIAGLIIDGKGFIDRNQSRGTEKEDFVHEALLQVKLIETQENRYIPKVVLTAWYDQLKDSLESRYRVFDKKKIADSETNLSDFFSYLKDEVGKTEIYKLRVKYSYVFNIVNNEIFTFSEETLDSKMFSLLNSFDSSKPSKTDFNLLRDVFENILIGLKRVDFIPFNLYYTNGKPDQSKCLNYIKGYDVYEDNKKQNLLYKAIDRFIEKNIVPDHIIYCFEFVKKLSNDLSHIETDKWTNNVFEAGVSCEIEILLWIERQFLNKD